MIRTLAFLCAALGLSGSAFAADLPPAPPPRAPAVYVPPVLPVHNWSGVYLGINGGYGFGSSEWTDPLNPSVSTSSGSFNTNGGLVGGTLGVNFQTGGFVFGAEGDWDWQGLQGTKWAFADNWTAKVEYLYVDLGNSTCNNTASCGFDAPAIAGGPPAVPANDTVKFTESMIRAGVNFKFNGW